MREIGLEKSHPAVRLRRPERGHVELLIHCPDDLVGANHAVRMVMSVVEKLDLERFHEPIKARAGQAGRDTTDPQQMLERQPRVSTTDRAGSIFIFRNYC
jgi:hypothetical protein